ncbi:hypothetical protein N8T08_011110 [Aspergillus melleus]|uniref:Uncharacterized protein n=1 Tax=Aspergillus melleus TaxID=138277 RepID=A0ACC3ARL8_9EURO|nr:hypothetical protein N8T08_011110 [Aspergillus melleus]
MTSSPPSQAWRIHLNYVGSYTSAGIQNNLQLEEIPKPVPSKNQIVVQMRAAALNFRDLLIATADPRYQSESADDGLSPLCDGSGIVSAVCSPDSRWKVGDKVVLASNTSWKAGLGQEALDHSLGFGTEKTNGLLQQYVVVDEDALVPLPTNLSYEEGACLAVAYATAWNALFGGPCPLNQDDTLVTQGTGGVSIATLQIAKASGARVIALTTSEDKKGLLEKLGADHVVNSLTNPNWADEIISLTSGRGADHVLEVVGAATIKESLRAVRQAGLVSVVGFLSPSEKHDLIPDVVFGAKTIRGLMNGSLGMLQDMVEFVEKEDIHPVVAKVFEWHDAKEAYKAMIDQAFVGKLVIRITEA